LQHREQPIEVLAADRPDRLLVRLPLGQLVRIDPVEQFPDGAAQGER
jgi:hypothetical protein